MKLSDLLESPQAHHVRNRAVTFRIVGTNRSGEPVKHEEAKAAFRFVDEATRAECLCSADKAVAEAYAHTGIAAPEDRRIDERNYHVLFEALRDVDDPKDRFATTLLQLKRSMVFEEARRVYDEYQNWVLEEFPPKVDEVVFAALVEDAKKNCLPDLLSRYDFSAIVTVAAYLRPKAGSGT